MNQNQQNIRTSILDRLIDLEPGVSHEPVQQRTFDLRQIKAAVVRDLENLLNTRRHILAPPAALTEVNNSLLVYGLGGIAVPFTPARIASMTCAALRSACQANELRSTGILLSAATNGPSPAPPAP